MNNFDKLISVEIEREYDYETQELINKLEKVIITITEEYISKFQAKSAKECVELSRIGYIEAVRNEYNERIKPYQKELEEIYLKAVPKIIIKKSATNKR